MMFVFVKTMLIVFEVYFFKILGINHLTGYYPLTSQKSTTLWEQVQQSLGLKYSYNNASLIKVSTRVTIVNLKSYFT